MTPRRGWLLALLLAALGLSGASADTRVFVRFKLLEPTETGYYVQIGAYIHVEPWTLPATVWPAGADNDRAKRVGSGVFTEWFDLGEYASSWRVLVASCAAPAVSPRPTCSIKW